MININKVFLFISMAIICSACFLRNEKTGMEDLIDETELIDMPDSLLVLGSLDLDSSKIEPFYPQEEKINDLVEEIAALKAQVRDYDSRIRNWDSSVDIFRKIQYPHLTHEIELTNGTLVNGNIIQENSDRMIVKTQIGQLTIDKSDIATIKNISPNIPELDFKGDATEEIHTDHRIFSGEIINNGFRRADFVRVIYKLYSEQTELVGIDSTFIDGSKFVYKSGVISDTCLEPGSSVDFFVKVDADSSLVRYVTREVKWDVFK